MLGKERHQLPTYVPYVDFLPAHVRQELFSRAKTPPEKNAKGQVKVKLFFEHLLDQYLDCDYGEPDNCAMPTMTSKRCANLAHVIEICEYYRL